MRIEGWESKLTRFIETAYRVPFAWGSHDCALWAAQWVREATGQDFASSWDGKYKTEAGAAKLMKKRGFANVEAIADSHLLAKPVMLARRGDILLSEEGTLGICHGRHGFFLTMEGVAMIDTLHCTKAWSVE